jgi:hypothetical protein
MYKYQDRSATCWKLSKFPDLPAPVHLSYIDPSLKYHEILRVIGGCAGHGLGRGLFGGRL